MTSLAEKFGSGVQSLVMDADWEDGDYVILLGRVSKGEKYQKTIPEQFSMGERVAKWLKLPVKYMFKDQQGRTTWPRTELDKTLEQATDPHCRAIIVWREDRILTSPAYVDRIFDSLTMSGTLLFDSERRLINAKGASNLLSAYNSAARTKMEAVELREKMRTTNKEKFLQGRWVTRPPYGTRAQIVMEDGQPVIMQRGKLKKVLVVHEAEMEIVREIFNLADNGKTFDEIEKLFEKRGTRTKTGAVFSKQRLREIVGNEFYMGIMTFGRKRTEHIFDDRKVIRLPKDSELIERMPSPLGPLIDPDQFYRVQQRIEARYHLKGGGRGNRKHAPRPLDTLIYCGRCLHRMTTKNIPFKLKSGEMKDNFVYYCGGANSIYSPCRGISHSISELKVFAMLERLAESSAEEGGLTTEVLLSLQGTPRSEEEIRVLRKQLEDIPKKVQRAKDGYMDGVLSSEESKAKQAELEAQRHNIEDRLATLTEVKRTAMPKATRGQIGPVISELVEALQDQTIPIEERQDVAAQLLHRIEFNRTNVVPWHIVFSGKDFAAVA